MAAKPSTVALPPEFPLVSTTVRRTGERTARSCSALSDSYWQRVTLSPTFVVKVVAAVTFVSIAPSEQDVLVGKNQ